jgi:hypothetical protein
MMQMRAEGQLPGIAVYLSRVAINQAVWGGGLILECMLAGVVFARRIAARFPAFAALMVFYPLRAVLLFACQERIAVDAYDSLFSVLSVMEFVLEILVAGEIGLRWARAAGSSTRRYWALVAIAGSAVGLAWSVAAFASGKVTVDRMEISIWFLMLGLFAAVFTKTREANLIRIAAGFAVFSLFQLVTLAGRLHAWTGHGMREYLAWSYVPAAAYIAVVIFWLAALRREALQRRVAAG